MTSRLVLSVDGMELGYYYDLVSLVGTRVHAVKLHDVFDTSHRLATSWTNIPRDVRIWIDYKLHDTPDTVRSRAKALANVGRANILTVHASGGPAMIKAALEGAPAAQIFAVTALTSLADDEVQYIYGAKSRADAVLRLASFAVRNGVHGIVCSANEVSMLRQELGKDVKLVVPGTRSAGVAVNDQKNVQTPSAALSAGASLLVIGRQITAAKNPVEALEKLEQEIFDVP